MHARDSISLTICDEIVQLLEDEGIQAVTDPCPNVDLSKVRGRHVFVTPGAVDVHVATRGADEETVDIAVSVVDKPKGDGIDRQLDLIFGISKLLSRRKLTHGTITAVTPQHDLESWWRLRVFSGSVAAHVWLGVHP